MAFDVWLKRRMAEHNGSGIDADALGEAIRTHPTTVGRWLAGSTRPNREQVMRLAIFFRVSPATILRQTNPEKFLALSRDALAQEIGLNELEKEVAEALRRLSPKRRAAFLLLLQDDDAKKENGRDF